MGGDLGADQLGPAAEDTVHAQVEVPAVVVDQAADGGVEELRVAVVGVGGLLKRHAHVRAAPGEAQPGLVDERHVALGVRHPHERGRGVGELAELRLAVADELVVPRPGAGDA